MFGILAKSAFDAVKKEIDNVCENMSKIDVEDVKSYLSEKANILKENIDTAIEKVRECSSTKFEVKTPFDKENETMTYSLDGNRFVIETKTKDNVEFGSRTITIPEDVDATTFCQEYDEENKVMIFIFNKFI